jgi:hypothetical protein
MIDRPFGGKRRVSPVRRISGKRNLFGHNPAVPIAVVVALTGEHFGFVMFAFLVSAAVATTAETSLAADVSFATCE